MTTHNKHTHTHTHLILLQAEILHDLVSLLLERDDDKSDEDVHKKERKHNKIYNVEYGHLHPVTGTGTLILKGGVHRVFQHTETGRERQMARDGERERDIKKRERERDRNLFGIPSIL